MYVDVNLHASMCVPTPMP